MWNFGFSLLSVVFFFYYFPWEGYWSISTSLCALLSNSTALLLKHFLRRYPIVSFGRDKFATPKEKALLWCDYCIIIITTGIRGKKKGHSHGINHIRVSGSTLCESFVFIYFYFSSGVRCAHPYIIDRLQQWGH